MTASTAKTMPEWATTLHRVDPRALGERRTFTIDGVRYGVHARGASVEGSDGVTRSLRGEAFEGVAARALEDADGNVTVTLELMHADPALSVPVLVANDLDDVAADWRDWSKAFALPMLMVEADGNVSVLDDAAGTRAAEERRRRATSRPRFLVRRRTGNLGLMMKLNGREMIARNAA